MVASSEPVRQSASQPAFGGPMLVDHLVQSQSYSASPAQPKLDTPSICDKPRRRLRGKQPVPPDWNQSSRSRSRGSALEVHDQSKAPCPKSNLFDMQKDQPAAADSANGAQMRMTSPKPRGHYDILVLPKTAEGAAIRAAYRRQALVHHPDKGGDPEQFRKVVAAFAELGDEAKRAAYDQNVELFGSLDGTRHSLFQVQQTQRPEDIVRWWYGTARVAQFKLVSTKSDAWSRQLSGMQEPEIHALLDLLRGSTIPVPPQGTEGPKGGSSSRRRSPSVGSSGVIEGIEGHKSGYRVVVSWAGLSVASSRTPSLAQAIDWQIALAWLRATAQARLRQCLGQAADPLVEKELLEALAAEPAMSLTFTASVQVGDMQLETPELPDLPRVLQFQQRLRTASISSVKSISKQLVKEAKQIRHDIVSVQKGLLNAALQELQKRSDCRRGRPATQTSRASTSLPPALQLTHFRPTRRIRGKSSPAVLAILEACDSTAKSRQAIVSRALAWQGIPQPGTPKALQESPAVPPPSTPRRACPSTPLPVASPLAGTSPRNGIAKPATPEHRSPSRPSMSPRATTPKAPHVRNLFASPRESSPRASTPQRHSRSQNQDVSPSSLPISSPLSKIGSAKKQQKLSWSCASPEPRGVPASLSPGQSRSDLFESSEEIFL